MIKIQISIIILFATQTLCGQAHKVVALSSKDLHAILEQEAITLIDVRTPSEFANGHLKNAGQVNFYALDFKQNLLLLSKQKAVYLYCNTGYRSKRAANFLIENGYSKVYNLDQGIMEWNLMDFPVFIEPNAKVAAEHKIQPDEYNAFLKDNALVLVDFYAPWCGPCQKMMPYIDSITHVYQQQVKVLKVNADASKKLVKEQSLASVPYVIIYKSGNIVYSHKGALDFHALTDALKKHF